MARRGGNPDQPRWPKGTPTPETGPGAGRWRDDGKPNAPRPDWADVASEVVGRRRRGAKKTVPRKAAPRTQAQERADLAARVRAHNDAAAAERSASGVGGGYTAPVVGRVAPRPVEGSVRVTADSLPVPDVTPGGVRVTSEDRLPAAEIRTVSRPETAVTRRVARVAAALHSQWRAKFKEQWEADPANAGKRPTRPKKTTDQAWIEAHGGNDTVDIYNTDYEDLPDDWQRENRDAGGVVESILARERNIDLADEAVRQRLGEEIHQAWLARPNNSYAKGGELDVPFADLPRAEQDKDTDQLATAMRVLGGSATPNSGGGTAAPTGDSAEEGPVEPAQDWATRTMAAMRPRADDTFDAALGRGDLEAADRLARSVSEIKAAQDAHSTRTEAFAMAGERTAAVELAKDLLRRRMTDEARIDALVERISHIPVGMRRRDPREKARMIRDLLPSGGATPRQRQLVEAALDRIEAGSGMIEAATDAVTDFAQELATRMVRPRRRRR